MPSILCPQCGQANDCERAGDPCWMCGQQMPLLALDLPQAVAAGAPLQQRPRAEAIAPSRPAVRQEVDIESPLPDIKLKGTPPTESLVVLALLLPVVALCIFWFSNVDSMFAALAINGGAVVLTAILLAVDA